MNLLQFDCRGLIGQVCEGVELEKLGQLGCLGTPGRSGHPIFIP